MFSPRTNKRVIDCRAVVFLNFNTLLSCDGSIIKLEINFLLPTTTKSTATSTWYLAPFLK